MCGVRLEMRKSISAKLLTAIVISTLLVTLLSTVMGFYFEHERLEHAQSSHFRVIDHSARTSLREALYNFDDDQIDSILGSIAAVQGVREAVVLSPNGETYQRITHQQALKTRPMVTIAAKVPEIPLLRFIANRIPDHTHSMRQNLTKVVDGKQLDLGSLVFYYNHRHMYYELLFKALAFVTAKFIETLLVCLVMFLICSQLVTRHIRAIADFFKRIDWTEVGSEDQTEPLQLARKISPNHDELDVLVHHINEMYCLASSALAEKTKEAEHYSKEVKAQQAAAINTAKLSSLGQMAGGIAHEINNPLTIIQGHCNILKKQLTNPNATPQQLDKSFTRISSSILRITEVTGGLLAFSRDLKDQRVVETTVQELVAKLDNIASLIFAKDSIDYSSYWQGTDKVIRSCEGPIIQIVTSLFTNSRDAVLSQSSKGKRWVKLEVFESKGGEAIEITVKDSGDGVSIENHSKLFEPFFTTKPIGAGAGLGLSICHGLAEELGGSISYDAHQVNTCFTIKLPYRYAKLDLQHEAATPEGACLDSADQGDTGEDGSSESYRKAS